MSNGKPRTLTPFGRAVKYGLINKNMTQTQLSNALGVNKRYLSAILYGARSGKKYIARIRELLDLDMAG